MCVRKLNKKRACLLQLSVLGKWSFFCAHTKSPNTAKIGVSAGTGENPKWHFWFEKCHFGKGLERGLYYLWSLKAVFAENSVFIVFSANTAGRHENCNLNKKLPKIGGCLPKCKNVFFGMFLGFRWFCFYFSVFFVLLFCKKRPKRLFSCNFWVFFYSAPPTGLSLQSFVYSS